MLRYQYLSDDIYICDDIWFEKMENVSVCNMFVMVIMVHWWFRVLINLPKPQRS